MNKHTQFCTLEFLNTDVLIAILSACNSFSDLASSIRTSPILLHAFRPAKPAVLRHVASNILGPATRDAALLAQTSRFEALTHDDLANKVDAAAQDYEARLRVASAPWLTTIDADTAVALTHVTRLTQFFIDLFCYFRFRYFAQKLDLNQANLPPSQLPLSRIEHNQIAQALLRRQLLVYFKGGRYSRPRDKPRFIRTVFSLLHS
ncbi:hypothetical protein M441DRAFT_32421 [Trichoderma asperellum CBS 433.97]|uniref:Uncharacterized protein n=1 Tax=Trichoderma asperellum (strain ATCC 204424 / CBS 433.97 / NBRC 101777) TaxID=1042311 RepID=A0A2T3YQS5_TRIA4|nr:hypothetical protein M441DRAFT_32421 [Trichoderma asperellum CBS 433.97]PTB34876.1 hypothetical protein M441DRAFT_32421 [Trichoderma asperellum CBS 433.97]